MSYSDCDYYGNEFLALCLHEKPLHYLIIFNVKYISLKDGRYHKWLKMNDTELCGLSSLMGNLHVYIIINFHKASYL